MTDTPETFPDSEMPTIIADTGVKCPNTNIETTYHEKKNIDEATRQNFMKKYVYETNTHKIYNIIVGQTNKHLQ